MRTGLNAGLTALLLVSIHASHAAEKRGASATRAYRNRLVKMDAAPPLLANYPEFIEPIRERTRYEAPPLVQDADADLAVRAWRFSYNARGIIEIPNTLRGDQTAIVVVHPWGIDDGQGWVTPQPAGCAFQCTPAKNAILRQHVRQVLNPFLKRLRGRVSTVLYSLPGTSDPIRRKLYRSVHYQPTSEERSAAQQALEKTLRSFQYEGQPLPTKLNLSRDLPVRDYFRQFPGLDAGAKYNRAGFWKLPVPVHRDIDVASKDVVIYDAEGYAVLRDFLRKQGVRHVILTGYNTDMCVCSTTAGYENLRRDFNVFLVGDATIATFPANTKPAFATNAAVCFASLNLLITQISWVKPVPAATQISEAGKAKKATP